MAIMELRAKATVISSWATSTPKWKDVSVELDETGIILKYLKRGEIVKKERYRFANLADVGMRIPDNVKLDPTKDHFGLRFYGGKRGDLYVILTLGENPLIFDEKKFESFIDTVFMILLNKQRVMIQFARIKGGAINMESEWTEGEIRILSTRGTKDAAIVQGKNVISLFYDLEDVEVEEKEFENKKINALKLKHLHRNESVTSYVYIPNRKVGLFLVRYLLNYNPKSKEIMEKIASEFEEIQQEIEEEIKRELKELERLSPEEQQILLALYSGIHPLELHQFLGISEEEVERIYDEMIDKGFLKIVMIRKIVDLTMDGRKIVNKLIKYGKVSM